MLTMLQTNLDFLHIAIWVVVFILAIALEVSTLSLVSIWFAIAALPAIVLALFEINIWYQILIFALISTIAFVLSRIFIKKKLVNVSNATNADSLIGEEILVVSDVEKGKNGSGKVRDITWTIVSEHTIKSGEFAIVESIKGNKLIVKNKEEN